MCIYTYLSIPFNFWYIAYELVIIVIFVIVTKEYGVLFGYNASP